MGRVAAAVGIVALACGQSVAESEHAPGTGGVAAAGAAGSVSPDASIGGSGGTQLSSGGAAQGGASGAVAFGGEAGADSGVAGSVGGSAGSGGLVNGGGSAGASGAPAVLESCTDGVDDDGDGQVDCEDQDCGPLYACAAPVPDGWGGPVVVYEGPEPAPDCSASPGFPVLVGEASSGLVAPPAVCPACSCAPSCNVSLHFWMGLCDGPYCGGCTAPYPTPLDGAGTCLDIKLPPGAGDGLPQSVTMESAPTLLGCAPKTAGSPSLPPAQITSTVRLCGGALAGKGCGAGACVPKPSAAFGSPSCVVKAGDQACPAGGYSKKSVYFSDTPSELVDTRACAECACGGKGGTCGGTVTVYSHPGCTGVETTLTKPSQCGLFEPYVVPGKSPWNPVHFSVKYVAAPKGGSCSASGGGPTGTVTASKLLTVCCE